MQEEKLKLFMMVYFVYQLNGIIFTHLSPHLNSFLFNGLTRGGGMYSGWDFVLLDVISQLDGFLQWILSVRPILCSIAGIISITRIAFLWMGARDKRTAIEETLYWVIALVVFFVGLEVINELTQLYE